MVDYRQMCEIASYGGFPVRYPHWRFGMEYERLSKSYAYGLHRIYEMVINTEPCIAYLLASNQQGNLIPLICRYFLVDHKFLHLFTVAGHA